MPYRGNVCNLKGSSRVNWIIGRLHAKNQGPNQEISYIDIGYQFWKYRLLILRIPVIDFGNTGGWTFSKIRACLRAKSKILRKVSRYRINIKKHPISLIYPFKEPYAGPNQYDRIGLLRPN